MDIFFDRTFDKYYQKFPLVLVDIGARGGVQSNWNSATKHLRVIGFEPDQQEFDRLIHSTDPSRVKYLNTALYKEKKRLDFHLARERGRSSIFLPNRKVLHSFPESELYDVTETVQFQSDTLDNQLLEAQIEDVDFIKIDTQGSELSILEGAERILNQSILGLEIEVEFVQTYEDQPVFSDIDRFVRRFGFDLFDLRPHYWKRRYGTKYGRKRGQIIFADALYIRTPEGISLVLEKTNDEISKKSKALRALSVCVLYGYLDYALEVFETTSELFSEEEKRVFLASVTSDVPFSNKIPHFPGKRRIALAFYALYSMFRPTHHGWATSANVLGNLD
jgi:FkbM family methyltransferase